jgi:hydrogenase maturation protein HypF
MVRSLAYAERLAWLSDDERRVIESVERPIVLVERKRGAPLAPSVAPRNPLVGVMLPYTPLHHLLLEAHCPALVMTSGNLAEEPLAYCNDEALRRLGGLADLFLLHDRDIDTRCDDSVVRVIAGAPVVLRRSRGHVPRGIRVPLHFEEPVLACGGMLKNTFCLGVSDTAYLGPHIGDLENLETYEAYEHAITRLEHFVDVQPAIVAHDLHPEYLSTQYALRRDGVKRIAVQHHHAHVASAMAEHGLAEPVIGVAWDGTGLGTDGTAWGSEVLVADYRRFERSATFRPIRLAGGDVAIREVWRQALALLDDAFDGDPPLDRLSLFNGVPRRNLTVVRQLIDKDINAPPAHGAGRMFDAAGAIGLARPVSQPRGESPSHR